LDILFGTEENNPSVTLEDEVDLYFSETGALTSSDPLAWWKANLLHYPCLNQLVKPLFAIATTSTIVKGCFQEV